MLCVIGNGEEQERYFFSYKKSKYRNGSNRMNRTTMSGYWKATGSDKKILSSPTNNNSFYGVRKTLVFHQGKAPNGSRTNWVMHEYRLIIAETSFPHSTCMVCDKLRSFNIRPDQLTNFEILRNYKYIFFVTYILIHNTMMMLCGSVSKAS